MVLLLERTGYIPCHQLKKCFLLYLSFRTCVLLPPLLRLLCPWETLLRQLKAPICHLSTLVLNFCRNLRKPRHRTGHDYFALETQGQNKMKKKNLPILTKWVNGIVEFRWDLREALLSSS